jgi:YNFM family putative membrane transporter
MPTAAPSVSKAPRQHKFRRATIPTATDLAKPSTSLLDLRVLMVTITGFCVFLDVYATQTLLPLFTRLFNASKFEVSLTVSATTIGIAVGAPIVGLLAERIGRRRTMAGSVALLTIPILLAATSPGLHSLIAWRFVQGLVMPGIIAVTMAYVSEEWAAGGAAAVMSAYVAGNVLGGVSGRFLTGMVADHFSWRAAFVVLGAVNALGAGAVWLWLPHSRQPHVAKDLRASLADMLVHLRRREILATFAVGMTALFALVGLFTYITFYLAAPPFYLSTAGLSLLFLVYLVGVVVTPVAGTWIDRLGHRTSLIAAAIASAAGVGLTLFPSLVAVIAGLAIASTGVFICQSAASSYLGHIAGHAKASAAGLYTTFYYLGGTLGAAIPAAAWRSGGWTACAGLLMGVLILCASLALSFWHAVQPIPHRAPTAGDLALASEG